MLLSGDELSTLSVPQEECNEQLRNVHCTLTSREKHLQPLQGISVSAEFIWTYHDLTYCVLLVCILFT